MTRAQASQSPAAVELPVRESFSTTPDSGARQRDPVWLYVAIVAWLAAVVVSWFVPLAYEFQVEPGSAAIARSYWPADSSLVRSPDEATAIFFMHPMCPCTRASLTELERAWSHRNEATTNGAVQLIVVATVPKSATQDWLTSDTVERSKNLSGATFVVDVEGREAERFGVTTSGTLMWFDAAGRRLYLGGLTASRGHEGANLGSDCFRQLLAGHAGREAVLPVFGCRLCLPSAHRQVAMQTTGQ
jgi:hypothetical protein